MSKHTMGAEEAAEKHWYLLDKWMDTTTKQDCIYDFLAGVSWAQSQAIEPSGKDEAYSLAYDLGLAKVRTETLEEAAKVAQEYADRSEKGELVEDEKLAWISTHHRIAGENIRDEILALVAQSQAPEPNVSEPVITKIQNCQCGLCVRTRADRKAPEPGVSDRDAAYLLARDLARKVIGMQGLNNMAVRMEDTLAAALAQVRAETIEEAAKLVEDSTLSIGPMHYSLKQFALAIRALSQKESGGG